MSCKCKNIIENFQGGTIPLDTTFLGNVDICNTGSTLSVSNIIGCSPITIGSDSGCTSGNTTLIVSGSSVFSCDIDVLGGIYSGGTNLIDIFLSGSGDLATVLAAGNTTGGNNITMSSGDAINSANGGGIITLDDGGLANSIAITTDNGSYLESWQFMDGTSFQLGFGQNVYATISSSGYDFLKQDADKDVFVVQSGRFGYLTALETAGYTNVAGSIVSIDLGASGATSNNDSPTGLFLNSGDFGGGAISTYNSGVLRSVALGGAGLTVKTSETAYANQISLQPSGNNFDGLLVPPTLTSDRNYSFQDASGTVAFLSDITPYVTGGTYISSASTINFTNTDGGTFSVTGITSGGGSSYGILGISDSNGSYTYYNDINTATVAASAGDVIEFFADIEETGTVSWNLVAGVNYNLNGHTYTLNESTGTNLFSTTGFATNGEVHFWNGKIRREGATAIGGNFDNIVLSTSAAGTFYFNDCVVENTRGKVIRLSGSNTKLVGGTYICQFADFATSTFGTFDIVSSSSVRNATILSKAAVGIRGYGGCKFFNCNIYSQNYIAVNSNNAGIELHNCTAHSDANVAINGTAGLFINTTFSSTANVAFDNGGKLIGCTCYSTSNIALKLAYSTNECINTVGYSLNNYGISVNNTSVVLRGSYGKSETAFGGLVSSVVSGCLFEGGTGTSDHAVIAIGSSSAIFNCTLIVRNTTANGISAFSATNVKYGNNTIMGNPTTPINANVSQAQTTTADSFGNIVAD